MPSPAAIVSVTVLVLFGIGLVLVFTKTAPAGAETAINVMLGALVGLAGQVVSYWVGSSVGSTRKTELMAATAATAAKEKDAPGGI